MAHTKAGGSTRLGRDSQSQRLGVKLFGGQAVKTGNIIVRQRGSRMETGPGAALGKDHTVFATKAGKVKFTNRQVTKFSGRTVTRTIVSIED